MPSAVRKTSRREAGIPETLPVGSRKPANRSCYAGRKTSIGKASMPGALPAGSYGPANRFRKPDRPLVALWSVALLGLWFSATAGDEPVRYRVENHAILDSLIGRAGDPARGEQIVRDPDKVTCLICHAIPIEGEPDPGNIGPPLHGVASRYTAGELRLRLVDPKRLNPDTVMPSYFARDGHHRVAPEYRGRSIYSASEIEDVIAYLQTLSTK